MKYRLRNLLSKATCAATTRSLPALLAAASSDGVTYSAPTPAAACKILVAAAHCAENIAAMMHAGAGDRMVDLVVACGSAGNDPVGDAAADVIRRLISVGGAQADAPATLVRADVEGDILVGRCRLTR